MADVTRLIRASEPILARRADAALGILVGTLGVMSTVLVPQTIGAMPPVLAMAVAVGTGALVAARRRSPIGVLVAICALVLVEQAMGMSLNFGGVALLLGVYTVAHETPRRTSLVVLAVLPGYLLVALLVYNSAHPNPLPTLLADLASAVAIYIAAWFIGDSVRNRRARTAELEARAERLERQQAETARVAVQTERALIARELHDVVAHSVSVMVIQAAGARRVMDEQPAEARVALASIETTGREALAEMRRLLGILRAEDAPAPLAPRQGLAGLGALIASAQAGGVTVELAIEGEPRPLAPGVDLAAYRIIQEALTNTIKHAAPAHATVRLRYEPDAIAVEVRDDGRARGGQAPMAETGHGLLGMEERVRLYGGEFEAGPAPSGGFGVRARIPTAAAA